MQFNLINAMLIAFHIMLVTCMISAIILQDALCVILMATLCMAVLVGDVILYTQHKFADDEVK